MKQTRQAMTGLLIVASTAFGLGVFGSSPASASGDPITIGLVYSATGGASSSFTNAEYGARAMFDAQNTAGGVNGHKIKLVVEDDGSTPSGNESAVQDVVENKGAFAVIDDSDLAYAGAKYLQQADVPVVGAELDGPEWGEQPYSNMFTLEAPTLTPFNGTTYAYTTESSFMKEIGVTKVAIISLNLPSAITNSQNLQKADERVGIKNCYVNNSIPIGGVSFGAVALAIKHAGCNGVISASLLSSNIALSQALQQTGVHAKQFYYTSYDQTLLKDSVGLHALAGTYSTYLTAQLGHPTPAQKVYLSNLMKYTPATLSDAANYIGTYVEAAAVIRGLEVAGKNPTRQAFISNLRKVGNFTANGLGSGVSTQPISFQHFGTVDMLPKTSCAQFVEVTLKGFVPYENDKAVCGVRIPVSG